MADKQPERFRGSSEIPLTDEGVRGAVRTAMGLAKRGGLDELMASSLGRTVHTAKIISHYTHAPISYIGDGLHPWHLGTLEGQAVTPENAAFVDHLMRNEPDTPLSGRGPLSTADGESFNSFAQRSMPVLQQIQRRIASNNQLRLGVVTHYRVKKLLQAWMKRGMGNDGMIDHEDMAQRDSVTPGGIDRFYMDENGPQMSAVDLRNHTARLLPGAYFIRHEATDWNDPQS